MNQISNSASRKRGRPFVALRPDGRGMLDDVVIEPVHMFRAELMSEGDLWVRCYLGKDGKDGIDFHVRAVKKGLLDFGVDYWPSSDVEYEQGGLTDGKARQEEEK